ncbi:MAG: DMT family transporter [Bacteroidales bacterium]|nr:DMT family transporter [Bacteroidales bacterium]
MSFQTLKIYLFAVLSMLFWGLSFVWFKIVVKCYDPITIIFLRLIISGSLMIVFMFLTRSWQTIKREHLKYFLLLSFSQPFCYFLGESFGLTMVSSTIASVIIATIPLFSPIAAYFMVKEKVTIHILAGIVVSFAGILLMLINPDFSLSASPKGVLLLFVAVFSAVAYSVIIRKISHEYNPVTIITHQNLIGAIYFLPLFLIFDFKHFITIKPDGETILAMLQLAVFASTLAYVFYIIAIKGMGMIKANVFTNLIPVFTGLFSFLILNEKFTAIKIAGMILVMFGVLVSQSHRIGRFLLKKN